MTYDIISPDRPNRPGLVTQLVTDEQGYTIKCEHPAIRFLIGWKLDRVRSWIDYKKWKIREAK